MDVQRAPTERLGARLTIESSQTGIFASACGHGVTGLHHSFAGISSGVHGAGLRVRTACPIPIEILTFMETKMLVLSRKLTESIRIGEGVTVTVLEVRK